MVILVVLRISLVLRRFGLIVLVLWGFSGLCLCVFACYWYDSLGVVSVVMLLLFGLL